MHPQPVEAGSAKAGNEAGVNVQNTVPVRLNDAGAKHAQKARQHHHINVVFLQNPHQRGVKGFAVRVVLAAHHGAFHPGSRRPLQRVNAGLAGDHQRDFAVGILPAGLGVQDGLQIGATAGH